MPTYREKPQQVEARVYDPVDDPDAASDVQKWCDGDVADDGMLVDTIRGLHLTHAGDYVVKLGEGQFVVMSAETFERTYEQVS